MKKTLCACALLMLLVMSAGCSFDILEDIGSDPHPPSAAVAELVLFVPPPEVVVTPDSAASSPRGRTINWDSGGFTLTPGQLFQIWVSYTDPGGDVVRFKLRDRDGSLKVDLLPLETYFSGTSGTVLCPATAVEDPPKGIEIIGMLGPHRLELWAEDSHLSRSEKVEFIITLVP